jgi:SAM-dependent methyltransferase
VTSPTAGGIAPAGRLGDTPARDYSSKLRLFNAFAERELRAAIATLALRRECSVLDAGCGTGEALGWLREAVGPRGVVVGVDVAAAHTAAARARIAPPTLVLQADITRPPLTPRSFDLVWAVNTVNHLHDARAGLRVLTQLVRRGGHIALGQSALLPEMYFAWDARLERLTNEAVRQYYRDRYGLAERELTGVRALVGILLAAGLRNVSVRTFVIERMQPLSAADEAYLIQAIFRGTWGERLRPYLAAADYAELERLCDPHGADFALRRADFHFLQTFTLATGEVAA